MKHASQKAFMDYNLNRLSDACDWADGNYHKKPLKSHPDKQVKTLGAFLENMKNGKIGLNTKPWNEIFEEYVRSRGYDWFSSENKRKP